MFYTYIWLRYNGTPYYVGKGTGRRGYIQNNHYAPCPKDVSLIITQEYETEAESLEAETFFIAFYGRKDTHTGILLNHTDGGEGNRAGWVVTEAFRSRCREIAKHRVMSAATCAKIGDMHRGKHASAVTRARMSAAHAGHSTSEETREKIRLSKVGKPRSAETVRSMTGWKHSEESRRKMSETKKRLGILRSGS